MSSKIGAFLKAVFCLFFLFHMKEEWRQKINIHILFWLFGYAGNLVLFILSAGFFFGIISGFEGAYYLIYSYISYFVATVCAGYEKACNELGQSKWRTFFAILYAVMAIPGVTLAVVIMAGSVVQ